MLKYILKRTLYSLPILIGVNLIVFVLFFFVNSPDDIARLHLGDKRVTSEQIDLWKRQNSLHLPRLYNAGWKKLAAFKMLKTKAEVLLPLLREGQYRIVIEAPQNKLLVSKRKIEILPYKGWQLNSKLKSINLPASKKIWQREFELKKNLNSAENKIKIHYVIEKPGAYNRLVLYYKDTIPFVEHFTQTIFFQKSVKMLYFQFGKSNRGKDIGDEIFRRAIPSLTLTLPAFIFGIFINIFLAMILAFFRGQYIDRWGVALCVMTMSISALFYIIGGQYLFSKVLKAFPVSGYIFGLESTRFILLPLIIALVSGFGGAVRFYRTIFLEEINKDYVRTARSKGLPERSVLFVHVLKNAMIPILTNVVVQLPFLFIGSLLLESFFSIPGMGSFLLDAISQQDFAIVQTMVFLGSFLYIIGLLLTDISYTIVDPQVKFE